MEIQGTIIQVLPLETGVSKSGNSWQKKNFVIETGGQYPKKVCFQIFGDKCNQLAPKVGDVVTVSFNAESKEFSGRWYTQLGCWNIEPQGAQTTAYTLVQNAPAPAPQQSIQQPQPTTANDLPF